MKFSNHGLKLQIACVLIGAGTLAMSGCSTSKITMPESPEWDGSLSLKSKYGDETTWTINGIEQVDQSESLSFTPRVGAYIITAGDGETLEEVKIFGIEETSNPPVMDNVIGGDWNDPPTGKIATSNGTLEFRALFVPYATQQLTEMAADPETKEVGTGDLYVGYELTGPVDHIQIYIGSRRWNISGGELLKATDHKPFVIEKKLENVPDISQDFNPVLMDIEIGTETWTATWADNGYAFILPDPSKKQSTGGGRQQLSGGETELKISAEPTKDSAYHTPLPVEKPDMAVYKPDWLDLKCPWEGTYEVRQGYGFEAPGWTHQTIGNKNSANDFYSLDLAMPIGVPIIAAADGRVVQSGRRGDSYGNYIVIDHGKGVQTIYAHLDSVEYTVDKGDPPIYIQQGSYLGKSGKSGTSYPHLHFSVHTNARASHSGANVGGQTTCPEPLDGYYGIRQGHMLTSTNERK